MSITTSPNPTSQATATFDRAVADLKSGAASATSAYTQFSEKALKSGAEFQAFGRDTVAAFIQAGQIFAAESQTLFRDVASVNQAAASEAVVALRSVLGAKTVREGLELQANFARTSAIQAVTEGGRFARAYIDLVEKVFAPIAARTYLAVDTLSVIKA